jgi:hypothetical protein
VARRRYQQGCLFIRGKRRKVWVLRYREDVMLPSGQIARINRSEIIGPLVEIPTRRIALRLVESKLRAINQGIYRPKTTLAFREFVETQWKPSLLYSRVKKPISTPTRYSIRYSRGFTIARYLVSV